MTIERDAAAQLTTAATQRLGALAPLIGVAALDDSMIPARAKGVVAELCDGDPNIAAEAMLTVMSLMWPDCAPEDIGHGDWWRTPLGVLCARTLGRLDDDQGAVTHQVAADMLGVVRGTVAQLVSRGTLDRSDDGRVSRAAVLRRLSRLAS